MRKVKLSYICDISSGGTPSRNNPEYFKGDIPWAKISDIENADNGVVFATEENISAEGLKNIRGKLFPKGTLLFAMYGSIGKVGITGRALSTNQAILGIRPRRDDEINLNYLKSWFESNKQKLINQGRGVALKNLSATIVRDLEIELPPLDDQIRIAHLLGKVEGLIAQRKQHLQQLDNLLKSVFLKMFGDPVRNERRWETSTIEELCNFLVDCPHSTPEYSKVSPGYYCVRSSDIVEGYLDLSKTYQVEKNIFEDRIARYRPQANDIVYSREGGRLGNAARITGSEPICLGQRMMLFQASLPNRPEFLWALLETVHFKSKLQSLIGGGAAPRVNIKDLKKLVVIKPDPDLQLSFSQFVLRIDRLRQLNKRQLADLEALYGVLSQQAFKGELDLSRVPLPLDNNEVPQQPAQSHEQQTAPKTFQLPEPTESDELLSAENRQALIKFWLNAWFQHYVGEPFSATAFIDAAYQRLTELTDRKASKWETSKWGEEKWSEEPVPFGIAEYEQIKRWVFDALAAGQLKQSLEGNQIQVTLPKRPANWGSW